MSPPVLLPDALRADGSLNIALFVHALMPDAHYGTETYTLELARALQQLGHRPTIVAATLRPLPAPCREEIDGVPVIRVPAAPAGTRATFHDPARRALYLDLLGELRPDVIHVCHFLYHTTAVHAAAQELGIPLFATFTDFHGFCHTGLLCRPSGTDCPGPSASRFGCLACGVNEVVRAAPDGDRWKLLAGPVMRWLAAFTGMLYQPVLPRRISSDIKALRQRPDLLRPALNSYRGAIVPTAFTAERYRANGIDVPMMVSRFGVDIDRVAKPPRRVGWLRIGYIGQISPHKGLHVLLEALRGLEGAHLELEVRGSMTQHPQYAQALHAMAGGLAVRFAGPFDPTEMAQVLSGIDLLVIPSLWQENSPLTLLQALATHTPVVVSDVAGMRDFIEPGRNGALFARGNADALREVLRGFLKDEAYAARLSQTTAYERTSLDMARDVLDLYAS